MVAVCIHRLYVDAAVLSTQADTNTASTFDWICGMGSSAILVWVTTLDLSDKADISQITML
jgi:hypothetical protein